MDNSTTRYYSLILSKTELLKKHVMKIKYTSDRLKKKMGLITKTQVLIATPILLLLLLVVFLPFNINPIAIDKFKLVKSNADTNVEEEEPLHFILRRLVRGQDRIQLDKTGIACHSDLWSDVCVVSKPVVMDNKALRLYVPSVEAGFNRTVKPYPSKKDNTAMSMVTPVEISIQKSNDRDFPSCDFNHNVPALVFSSGGFTGNLFHEFDEVIIPLFITSRNFRSNLKFVVTDFKPWMVSKYNRVLSHLSRYDVINPAENGSVHCFPGAVVGVKFHDLLALNSTDIPGGYNMSDFKHFLREAYSLKASHVSGTGKPVVMLISRSNSRVFLNEDEMEEMMVGLGFEVVVATPYMMANLDRFSGLVNRCSIMVGAHGAGLTNSVFLPAGAVVVQVVPLGLDWASNAYFGGPVIGMGLRYLEYKVEPEESSLLAKYGKDNPVITDPNSILLKGYGITRAIYVDGQNFMINLVKFKETMLKAMKLLGLSTPLD